MSRDSGAPLTPWLRRGERRQRDLAEKCFAEGDLLSPRQWCVDNRRLLRLDFEILLREGRESPDGPLAGRVAGTRWIGHDDPPAPGLT